MGCPRSNPCKPFNAERLTSSELKSLKTGDLVIMLITNDSDDYYDLKNRLHLGEVVVKDISVGVDGFTFYFDHGSPDHEGACLIKPKNSNYYRFVTDGFTTKLVEERIDTSFLNFLKRR